ncbi:hypothetical protein [Bradyrhizobium ottawaense]|uniref:hypothetical protein n=1 Tax=Bradyrhizobium ottawaense TaxID=931866 RepID=UPI003518C9EE
MLNYAPAVPLRDWLKVDGYELVLSRASADSASRIASALKTIDLPLSILSSQTPASILETYIRADDADKKLKRAETKFVELDQRVQQLARWKQGYSADNRDLFEHCETIVQNLVKELIHHRLAGYYFLPRLEADSEDTGFVILLREVSHLPRDLARLIATGLDATNALLPTRSHWLAYIDFTLSDFAMPVGELTSPQVEHLLQTFSHLFGRIGLPDPDNAKVEALCAVRPQ